MWVCSLVLVADAKKTLSLEVFNVWFFPKFRTNRFGIFGGV